MLSAYEPYNEQEAADKAVMLAALLLSILSAIQYIRRNKGVIDFHDC